MDRVPYLFPDGARLGADNLVLRAKAKRHRVDRYAGPLSIKTVLSGRVTWLVRGRELVVDPSSFLVVSSGEEYSMNIQAETPVETCCAFFAPGFVERVAGDLVSPDLTDQAPPSVPYLSALHRNSAVGVKNAVQTLASRCFEALEPSGYEEAFVVLAAELLRVYQTIREQGDRVPAARESTRRELFRRLLIGREYLHSHSSGSVSLAATARAACLSPFHFHRGFTHAFEQTPHTYLTNLRLDQARARIEAGSSVLAASLEAGFSNPSAFSRLFRSRFGELPGAVRRKFARSG